MILSTIMNNDLSKSKIQKLLEKYDAKPLKKMGQNFLCDKNIINKIVSVVELSDTILEIGPGLGSLTIELSKKAKHVICVEKDKKMVEILKKETLTEKNNISIIEGDILKKEIEIKENYNIVANLPFYITSPVIRKFLEKNNPPQEMILLMQKEVAKRICANPPNMSILSLSVQFYADPKILFHVSRNSFWPIPNVDCSVIKIKFKNKPKINKDLFFKIVKAGFSKPRAQLLNNLSNKLKLNKDSIKKDFAKINIDPTRRSETLKVEEWIKIGKLYD